MIPTLWTIITKKWLLLGVLFIVIGLSVLLLFKSAKPAAYPGVNMPTRKLVPDKDYVSGQISVQFKKNIPQQVLKKRLAAYGASIISVNEAINATLIKVPKGKEMEVMQQLSKDNLIEYAEYDYKRQPRFIPNDPSYNQQWHLQKIQADKAWDITRGAGVKIAVVDSGVDINHPDLKSKIAATKGSVTDTVTHGTHVAGIIAAATNNAIGIASVCPDCRILAAKDSGNTDSGAAAAITWAADQGAKAINMSWGGPNNSQTLKNAIDYAWSKGALPVAAVQNENINNSKDYPSSYANVMNVTNTTSSDVKFTNAGYGTWVWIAAPGTNIYSTVPGNTYENKTGTSMATPVIVGTVGLVAATQYGTSPSAIRQRICNTADRITGTGTQFKCGRVNAFKAVGGGTPTAVPTTQPTAIPTPQPTVQPTVQPTQQPTPQPTAQPTAQPTQQPTAAVVPSSTCLGYCPTLPPQTKIPARFNVEIFLHGIGNSGDNTNPTLSTYSNKTPKHTTQNATLYVINSQKQVIAQPTGIVTYDSQSGSFKGTIQLDLSTPNGIYTIKLKTNYHLAKISQPIQAVASGNAYDLPAVHLVTGNTDNDDKLDVLDYSRFLDCFASQTTTCTEDKKSASDLNDDGIVNSIDYNLFIREISMQSGS